MALSSYLAGNRIYRGASNAPTRGTVDPMGYVERSLNNPSQRRSGLASAALRRLQPTGPGEQPGTASPGGISDRFGRQRTQQLTNNPRTAGGSPVGGAISGGGGSGLNYGGSGGQVGPPRLTVDGIGKLKPQLPNPMGSASQGATSLPFDAEAADAQVSLQAQKNRFESDATAEQGRIEREYVNQRRDVEDEMPEQQRRLLENYAGRGLAYSSGYAYDQGDQKSQYARLLAELEQGKTGGIADLLRQRGQFNDEWSGRLQAIQQAAARRLAEQAGDLGLGGEVPGSNEAVMDDLFGGGGGAPAPQAPVPPPTYTHGTGQGVNFGGGTPAPAPAPVSPPPAPVPQLALNNPAAPPSHMNPYYNPVTQVQTPNMIDGGDPGMRGGLTIAQIAANSAPKLSAGVPNFMGMTPEQVAAALGGGGAPSPPPPSKHRGARVTRF